MQFGPCLPNLMQKIWEADPKEGPVLVSKWDISDAFHRCHLRPKYVGTFSYVVPPTPSDPDPLICIDIVLLMGWVNSLDLFCSTSDTVTGIRNVSFPNTDTPEKHAPTNGLYQT